MGDEFSWDFGSGLTGSRACGTSKADAVILPTEDDLPHQNPKVEKSDSTEKSNSMAFSEGTCPPWHLNKQVAAGEGR